MKNWSGHIIFDQEFQWSALEKAFPEIWAIITRDIKQKEVRKRITIPTTPTCRLT